MRPDEMRKSAAGDSAGPYGAAMALTDGELAQLCRWRMREDPEFATLVLQRAPEDEQAAYGEAGIVPQAEPNRTWCPPTKCPRWSWAEIFGTA